MISRMRRRVLVRRLLVFLNLCCCRSGADEDSFFGGVTASSIATGQTRRKLIATCKVFCQSKGFAFFGQSGKFVDEILGDSSRCFAGTTHAGVRDHACFLVTCIPELGTYNVTIGSSGGKGRSSVECKVPGSVTFLDRAGAVDCDSYSDVCDPEGRVIPSRGESARVEVEADLRRAFPSHHDKLLSAFDDGRFFPHLKDQEKNGVEGEYFIGRKAAGCAIPWATGHSQMDLPTLNLVEISGLNGDALVQALDEQNSECVDFIEQDFLMIGDQPQAVPEHLDAVDEMVDSTYTRHYTGKGVDVYIVDTGVDSSHAEFGDRVNVAAGRDFTGEGSTRDPQGHGTHVAGTCCGTHVGIAPEATVIPLRTLGSDGSGRGSWTLQAVDYMLRERQRRISVGDGRPMVASASLGGPFSPTGNEAWKQLAESGVTVVVAAGNDNSNARQTSPASEPTAITVGAVDNANQPADFSNFGSVLDVWAAGVQITSAQTGGGYSVKSGTSMATPMVSGAAAMILEREPSWSPSQVLQELVTNCIIDKGSLKQSTGKILRTFASMPDASQCVLASTPPPSALGDIAGSSLLMVFGILALLLLCVALCVGSYYKRDVIQDKLCPTRPDSETSDSSTYTGIDQDEPPPPPPPPPSRPAYNVVPAVNPFDRPGKKVTPIANPFDDPSWGAIEQTNPNLALSIVAGSCAECVSNRGVFENNCEEIFKDLRKSVLQGSEANLAAVPDSGKATVWEFLVLVAERRHFYVAQAGEVSRRLQTNSAWVKALSRNKDLQKRKKNILG